MMEQQRRRLASLTSALTMRSTGDSSLPRLKLGVVGLGAIGLDLVRLCGPGAADSALARVDIVAVLVQRPRSAQERKALGLPSDIQLTADVEEWFRAGPYDAVLEVAGHSAVRKLGARVLGTGAQLLVTSVGAFADASLLSVLVATAEKASTRLCIPSAGIGALDILGAAAVGGLDSVTMTVRKDPSAWFGTVAEEHFDLNEIEAKGQPQVLFEGSARDGAAMYPQNVNISAAVALAGIGTYRQHTLATRSPFAFFS